MSKWEEEDLHGARTLFNEISNDDLMPNELDHGFRKGKLGKSVGVTRSQMKYSPTWIG